MVEVTRFAAAELGWDPESRFAVLRFVDEAGAAGRPEAEHLTAALERWVGDHQPFRFMVDCTEIGSIDAAWRQIWADFFIAHREQARIAWFNASPEIDLIVTMFRKGTGVTGEVFACEDEARAYLRERGA